MKISRNFSSYQPLMLKPHRVTHTAGDLQSVFELLWSLAPFRLHNLSVSAQPCPTMILPVEVQERLLELLKQLWELQPMI